MANDHDRPAGSKEDLLALPLERTPVTINGKQYQVRGLTADEEARIGRIATDEVQKRKLNLEIVAMALESLEGQPIFTKEDFPAIQKIPGRVVRLVVETAMRASGLDEESRKALGKLSAGTGEDASSSG